MEKILRNIIKKIREKEIDRWALVIIFSPLLLLALFSYLIESKKEKEVRERCWDKDHKVS